MSNEDNRFSLIMLNDSGVSLGLPLSFRGTVHATTREPKRRRFSVTVDDGHANVIEHFE